MQQTDCIGIDIGYGFTKTYRSGDKKMFPTAVTLMAKDPTFSDLSPIAINGHRFLVGKEAEREGGTTDTCQSGFVPSDAWLAILGHCLRINNFVRGEIVLGVPPGKYSREYSGEILDAIRASDIRINGEPYRINGSVRIIPQGAGIFFRYVKDNQDGLRKNVTVIDVGHHTVDMTFFAEGKYVESATETQEIGVWLLLDAIAKAFCRENRFPIGLKAALDILRDGQITYLGTPCTIDVREEVDRYTRQISSVINRYIEKLPVQPDLGIMGGGGAVIKDLVSKHNLLVVNEPAMANAIGYWYYGSNGK